MQPPIPVDEKLARGLTMAEVRAILRGGREAGASSVRDEAHPVRAAFKPVAFRYATGRRPDAGFVQRLVEKVDAFYGAAPATVFRQAETPPPTEGIPGHTRRYLMLVPTSSDERCRSLLASCVCFDIRRACVMLTQMPLCEIDLHAIERFHLRTRSGLVRDALASFGIAGGSVAMEYSAENAIPYLSRVDAGTIEFIRRIGPRVVSSGDLVGRFEAAWDAAAIATHRAASEKLYRVKDQAFAYVGAKLDAQGLALRFEQQRIFGRRARKQAFVDARQEYLAERHAAALFDSGHPHPTEARALRHPARSLASRAHWSRHREAP